jgi:hypothetical protein
MCLVIGMIVAYSANGTLAQRRGQITEITYETPDGTAWGLYEFRSDRTVTLTTWDYKSETRKTIQYQGRVYSFDRLAATLRALQFFSLRAKYPPSEEFYAATTVTATRNGKRFLVKEEGGKHPWNLWAIEAVLQQAVKEIDWDKKAQGAK